MTMPHTVLALSSSPRRAGNSRLLAEAVLEGAAEAGHSVRCVHVADHVSGFLRNCRECRRDDGSCGIDDDFRNLFLDMMLPADALVLATPVWWYGMSASLKNVLDRMFCYYAHSYPDHERVHRELMGKRLALVLSAEETNLSARLAIVHQVQEICRYLHYSFVGVVTGIGNSTGEVRNDPNQPLAHARELGRRLFEIRETDYKMDTERPGRVWDVTGVYPSFWR
ncbi:MAG TPA: flavodoxin family protein [Alphaproteobacteria bacterium]|nr:flavodoxin family protein [Alphaproteobacteria bacterium]